MRAQPALFSLTLAAAAIGNVISDQVNAEGWSYSDPELGKFTINGVCSIDSKVDCWDQNGSRLPTLAADVQKQLQESGRTVEAKFGKKNRYLIAGWDSKTRDHPGLSYSVKGGTAYGPPNLILLALPADAKTADVTVKFDVFGKPELKMPPKSGKSAKDGDREIKIKKIVRSTGGATARMAMAGDDTPVWRLYLEPKGLDLGKVRTTKALENGDDFKWVDLKGTPIAGNIAPIALKPAVAMLTVTRSFKGDEWWIDSNINPDKFAEIGFVAPRNREVTFAGIPLDPSQP